MPPNDPSPWQPPTPGSTPAAPPPAIPTAPPPPPGPAPGMPPAGYGSPPNYPAGYGAQAPMFVAVKPPRPRTTAAALLMLIGGLVMIVGAALPWISDSGTDYNAFEEWTISSANNVFIEDTPPGGMFVLLGVVLIGFGIATLAAGRLLPIMIIGIVFAAFAVLGTITHLADYVDVTDSTSASLGAGIIVTMVGSAAALAGAIAGCATRRKWRPGMEPR